MIKPYLFPAKLDALAATRAVEAFSTAAPFGEVEIDFARLETPEPFAMLMIACAARNLRNAGATFRLHNADLRSYAAHMGLFAEFDEEYAPNQLAPRENERYVAIRTISRLDLLDEAAELKTAHVGDVIQRQADRLARLLTQEDKSVLVEALAYCLREIIRNAYEHSRSDEILICAQYRPSSNRVDMAFADRGCGVFAALRSNASVEVTSEMDALKVALMPGISGTPKELRFEDDPWVNSGYGLFMTHQICRAGGSFTICSGDAMIRLAGDQKTERKITNAGTIIGMSVQLDTLKNLNRKALSAFAEEGSRIAKKLKGAIVTASAASVNLRIAETS